MNVIKFEREDSLSVEDVINTNKNVFSEVIMLGWDKDGFMFYDGTVSKTEAIYLLELMKKEILEGAYSYGD